MKAKDLPAGTNLQLWKVRLPKKVLAQFRAYAGGAAEMYVVGDVMNYGFMMSPLPPGKDGRNPRRMYPLPPGVSRADILDWTVVGTAPSSHEKQRTKTRRTT